ncbi:phosphotransferase [Nocardiopsis protaetiae]|uniref:phosphotransferase n=2 Tax=Nocardiopsis protaetiae TaxID=3382270 RepID=UPI00387B2718
MNPDEIARLRTEATTGQGGAPAEIEVLHSWALSHVERLTFPDGDTAVFKTAREPFTHEDEALTAARQAGMSVPRVLASVRGTTTLGMLIEDLGEPAREPTDADGAAMAVHLHSVAVPDLLPPGDTAWLASLPARALRTLEVLREHGRWPGSGDIAEMLEAIAQAAPARAEGAMVRPFGWVHSEFHPTSLLVRADGRVFTYDLARAFCGPGLLDLVSWQGTTTPAAPDRARAFLERYVEEGGPTQTLADRGGLPAQDWALGWHRVWIVEWYLAQAAQWIADPTTDPAYERAVRAHTREAAELLHI